MTSECQNQAGSLSVGFEQLTLLLNLKCIFFIHFLSCLCFTSVVAKIHSRDGEEARQGGGNKGKEGGEVNRWRDGGVGERRRSEREEKEDFIYIIPESQISVDLHPCKGD